MGFIFCGYDSLELMSLLLMSYDGNELCHEKKLVAFGYELKSGCDALPEKNRENWLHCWPPDSMFTLIFGSPSLNMCISILVV